MSIDAVLTERRGTHGDYQEHAAITQQLEDIMRASGNWNRLEFHEKETLHMIAHKIGRILAGDPHFHDHWVDMAGYAKLSADRNAPG